MEYMYVKIIAREVKHSVQIEDANQSVVGHTASFFFFFFFLFFFFVLFCFVLFYV